MSTFAFHDIDLALRAVQAPVSAAEAHGCLCGALCTVAPFTQQAWMQELLPDDAAESSLSSDPALLQLYRQTVSMLSDEESSFAPLLPHDDAQMPERVRALAQWTQGFLYGFGLGATQAQQQQLPGDIPEVLRDLSEIARADDGADEVGEAVELAYMELVEYLRAAVQLLFAELQSLRASDSASRH